MKPKRRTKLTPAQSRIVKEIRRLHQRGEPLNITAVKRNHPKLIEEAFAIKPFWGWKQALAAAGIDYRDIKVHLEVDVQCELCGEWRMELSSHLSRLHGTNKVEYRIDYPGAAIKSEECRSRLLKKGPREMPHWEPLWSKEYALDRMAEAHRRGWDMARAGIHERDPRLVSAAVGLWGSWDAALKAIGLDPRRVRKKLSSQYHSDKEAVLNAIRHRKRQGLPLNGYDVRHGEEKDSSLFSSACRLFGSWRAAIEAAGLRYERIRRIQAYKYPSRQAVIAEIRGRRSADKPLNFMSVYRGKDSDGALYRAALRYFATWDAALRAAGVPLKEARKAMPNPYESGKMVQREIRRRARNGLPLSIVGVMERQGADPQLIFSAQKHFGGWRQAIEAAGLDYGRITGRPHNRKYATPSDVVNAIRLRQKEKRPLHADAVARRVIAEDGDGALYYAGIRHFGSWQRAIEASGIDFADVRRVRYPSPASTLEEIQRRHRLQLPLNVGAVHVGEQCDPVLLARAREQFGSWEKALGEAGLDYSRIKRPGGNPPKYPTKASVLKEIERLHRNGLSLRYRDVFNAPRNRDYGLIWAVRRWFENWRGAVEAAGLDYNAIHPRLAKNGRHKENEAASSGGRSPATPRRR